jgi:hypothetical protein
MDRDEMIGLDRGRAKRWFEVIGRCRVNRTESLTLMLSSKYVYAQSCRSR